MIVKLPETELDKILSSKWFKEGYIELYYSLRKPAKRLTHACQALSIIMGSFTHSNAESFESFDDLLPYLETKVKNNEDLRRQITQFTSRNK